MAVINVVKLSESANEHRLDAEYYQPEKLEFLKILKINGKKKIKEEFEVINEIFDPKRDRLNMPATVFDLSDVQGYLLEEGTVANNSNEIGSTKKIFRKGDVIISRLRPYLREVTFVGFNENLKLGSTEFIVLRKRASAFYKPQTLFAFLITEFVQTILNQSVGGVEHPRFQEKILLNLYLPSLTPSLNEEIKCLVDRAYEFHSQGKLFYSQAEALLLSELGLQDYKPKDKLFYKVRLSEAIASHRIDAEYFNPGYEEIIERIKKDNIKLEPLNKFIVSMVKGIEIGSERYQEDGIPFIRVSNLSKYGLIDKDNKYLSEEDYHSLKDRFEPQKGEILLTKDATPGIAYFLKEPIKGIISSGILRLKIKEINPEYLCLCINSIAGKMQIERDGGGSIITHWKPEQIKQMLIPILPLETQQKIAELVEKSHESRRKAKELLEEAKRKVEEIIEKG